MSRSEWASRWAVVAVAVASGMVVAADGFDMGRHEYEANCVACHGKDGRGGGAFADQLNTRVPDLTLLSQSNGGVFPHQRVYRVIDGRDDVRAHGARDMPIWGQDYLEKAESAFFGYGLSREGFVRSRILALIDYLHRLQGH